eukprot:1137147-Pelagomonas_calceolata.AAC.4
MRHSQGWIQRVQNLAKEAHKWLLRAFPALFGATFAKCSTLITQHYIFYTPGQRRAQTFDTDQCAPPL